MKSVKKKRGIKHQHGGRHGGNMAAAEAWRKLAHHETQRRGESYQLYVGAK
jgi:hypothetical protein